MRSLLIGHSILAGEVSGECGGIVKNCYGELFTRRDKEVLRGLHCTAYDEELLRRGGRGVRPYTVLIAAGAVVVAFGFRVGLPADLCAEPHMARWACA